MMMSEKNKMLLGLFIALFGIGGFVICWLGFASRISCGAWDTYDAAEMFGGFASGGDFTASVEGRCAPGKASIWGTAIGMVVLLVFLVVGVFVALEKYRASDRVFIKDITSREGIAKGQEVNRLAGRKALEDKASSIRPGLEKPRLEDVGRLIGVSQGQQVWTSMEDSIVLFGPPRSGKGFYVVINQILDSPGAVVTTSTRADNLAATFGVREKIGPCTVFDPQGISGVASQVKWSPYQGCESPTKAETRAQALIGATPIGTSSNNKEWAEEAVGILQILLHAAALGQVRIKEFARWGATASACQPAVDILKNHPDAEPGWGDSLKAVMESDPRMMQSKWMGVSAVTKSLRTKKIAESLDPAPGDEVFDPEEFIKSKGTLYLLGSKTDGSAVAQFQIALLDEITNTARRMASQNGTRLDPPLSVILDEIANLAAWEALPQLMSDGGGSGISPLAVFQSPAQIRKQWGKDDAEALVDSAILQMQLGGSGNVEELRRFSDLMDQRKVKERSRSVSDTGGSSSENERKEAVMTAGELRRLPSGYALLMNRNGRPIIVKMKRWIDRKDADQIKASQKRFKELMATGGTITPAKNEEAQAPVGAG